MCSASHRRPATELGTKASCFEAPAVPFICLRTRSLMKLLTVTHQIHGRSLVNSSSPRYLSKKLCSSHYESSQGPQSVMQSPSHRAQSQYCPLGSGDTLGRCHLLLLHLECIKESFKHGCSVAKKKKVTFSLPAINGPLVTAATLCGATVVLPSPEPEPLQGRCRRDWVLRHSPAPC